MSVIEEIEKAAVICLNNFESPNSVFLSNIKAKQLENEFGGMPITVHTSAGLLGIFISDYYSNGIYVCDHYLLDILNKLRVIK